MNILRICYKYSEIFGLNPVLGDRHWFGNLEPLGPDLGPNILQIFGAYSGVASPSALSMNLPNCPRLYTRQRAQGHRTYEVGIAKPEVRLLLSLQALAVLVSDN